MLDVDKLFRQGFFEFLYTLQDKEYNVRLYLQEEVRNFCHAAMRKQDLPMAFPSFLQELVVRQDFEVYHLLLLEESTYHPLYTRLYSVRVEVAEPKFRRELDRETAAAMNSPVQIKLSAKSK